MSDNGTTQTQTDIICEIRDNINDNMTLSAIKQLAKHLGISKYSTMKKSDIIQKITGLITSYPITKQTEIKDICVKSRNIGEDIINYLNQPQTQEQAGTDAAAQITTTMARLTIQEPQQQPSTTTNTKNRGTGAGGANTNVTGLSYEAKTDLANEYTIIADSVEPSTTPTNQEPHQKDKYTRIKFTGSDKVFIKANKSELHKIMTELKEINTELEPASGCKNPDEAYISLDNKRVFIIEKKFQQTGGSVDEKIQTGVFKQYHYSKLFPNFTVEYIYCLSDWFKKSEYKSVLEYLLANHINIFWGSEPNYKQSIVAHLCSRV
jgi:hypothetical protein